MNSSNFLESNDSNQSMSYATTTSVIPTTELIGGVAHFINNLHIYLPYVLFSSSGVIVGIIGNSLIIGSILSIRELRSNATCILILNLALADMAISVIVDSFTVTGVLVGKAFFDKYISLCKFIAASCMISCGTSLVTMGFLAINRYISIFYNNRYNRIFRTNRTILYCLITWIAGFLANFPNLVGWGDLVYDLKALSCVFDRLKKIYTITFSVTCIIIPCLLIAYCYARIFLHAYRIKKKIQRQKITGSKGAKKSDRQIIESAKLAKCLFASFFLFAICWLPVAIIFLVDLSDHLPVSAHVFTNLPAHLNSALNPIFYGIFNSKMREGYKVFINIIFCGKIFRVNGLNYRKNNKKLSAQIEQTVKNVMPSRILSYINQSASIIQPNEKY